MKKLQLLTIVALSTAIVQAYSDDVEIRSHRTHEEKTAYFVSKQQNPDFQEETPEFRFALKFSEYFEKLENGEMSSKDFKKTIAKKIENYLEKSTCSSQAALAFLSEYLNLTLSELKDRVGTKDETGTMRRYAHTKRTPEQRATYLQGKKEKGVRMETPEFRFALKLSEYKESLEDGKITKEEFNRKIDEKSDVYLSKVEDKKAGHKFIKEYKALSVKELKARVGSQEEEGSMQRFID